MPDTVSSSLMLLALLVLGFTSCRRIRWSSPLRSLPPSNACDTDTFACRSNSPSSRRHTSTASVVFPSPPNPTMDNALSFMSRSSKRTSFTLSAKSVTWSSMPTNWSGSLTDRSACADAEAPVAGVKAPEMRSSLRSTPYRTLRSLTVMIRAWRSWILEARARRKRSLSSCSLPRLTRCFARLKGVPSLSGRGVRWTRSRKSSMKSSES
uniref:Secreted protein n=1 Tax=Arundo donax TaxID=35708 RepID=A0A0A9BGY3_ARUDO